MYSTLMIHLDLNRDNARLLDIAAALAERFEAGAIGIAASQPLQMAYGDGYISGFAIEQERADLETSMAATEEQFRNVMRNRARSVEWRASVTFGSPAAYVACQARSADLLVIGVDGKESWADNWRRVDIGDLTMQVGRPVLVVPAAVETLTAKNILLGWKDTREARRAASDALPFLKAATRVAVVEIADEISLAEAHKNVDDVTGWLKRHGVAAEAMAMAATSDATAALDAIADKEGADLIVAGAYGHSRFREWVLGGVTHDLLLHPDRCALVSH